MLATAAVALLAGVACARAAPPQVVGAALEDRFSESPLSSARWTVVTSGDFSSFEAHVVVDEKQNGRLGLRAGTLGTKSDTVKYLGVCSNSRFPLVAGVLVGVEIDWNNQDNGSYLSASLTLSPRHGVANPLEEADWIRLSYVGVPPGLNARLEVVGHADRTSRTLYNEGWPHRNRAGRKIGRERVEILILEQGYTIRENEQEVFSSPDNLSFDSAHVCLLMSTHSNYAPREIFFDNVWVGDVE